MSIILPNFCLTCVVATPKGCEQQSLVLTDYLTKNSATKNLGLILYFYPKDNTTGCSTQAQDFSHFAAKFASLGYQIIGVSRDSVKSHEKFIQAKGINFPLISDSCEQLCQHFGVIGEKQLYGKTYLGIVRSTFVFDKNAKLVHELRNIKAKGHVEKLFAMLTH
ncbi:ahpC/TSA family protein [Moraxella macacae 0408225]|uniref:thioredoxin-dependent peroxiredoxin n=1 Tax=Moraxella macacae 0408225 TaxID=1230338 RepID=L2F5N2_9GAMM|nr:peroxiredoxin [Moraxella macacae]ELA08374.1 ahpC/TSA family protein [Moraxella macacae 0408225]